MFLSYVNTLLTLIVIFKADYHLRFGFFQKKYNKSMQKVLPSGLGLLRGGRARTIASDRIFKSTVHCTLNSLINNKFNVSSYTHCTIVDYFLEKVFYHLTRQYHYIYCRIRCLRNTLKQLADWLPK